MKNKSLKNLEEIIVILDMLSFHWMRRGKTTMAVLNSRKQWMFTLRVAVLTFMKVHVAVDVGVGGKVLVAVLATVHGAAVRQQRGLARVLALDRVPHHVQSAKIQIKRATS